MSWYLKFKAFLFPFWAGLISAISFLEAWIKFRADGVTREIGLSIGSLVFTVLNRIELTILLIIWLLLFLQNKRHVFKIVSENILICLISLVLLLQTIWLLPNLVHRAEEIIAGNQPSSSSVHMVFIIFEAIKLILLVILSFKANRNNEEFTPKI
ncbi:hypothetical protein [Mangrovibacterium diazotrophicum]|uniref:DUF4149 domain-containing protein n=1 Tax=Mangrovibacterium diazotrophicum TaxID=1261403 RepID=A0A419W392_9BACT|nr:hypothetical protein [Mangrovibacterium diazotrophicum]RKD89770.1 hypothetical protein BC643_0103 [Mangrovibacterium diazotrophicum]